MLEEAHAKLQRGMMFYHPTAEGSRLALRGQRRFARRGRHARLLVPPEGCQEVPGDLRRSLGSRSRRAAQRTHAVNLEKDLIDMFRQYSELSGGPFPDAVDTCRSCRLS